MSTLARTWRIVFGLIGWATLATQYWLVVVTGPTTSVLGSTIVFFSYFTLLTNILVALALTLPVAIPHTTIGRWFEGAGNRAAVAMYIAVVGIIYHLFLHATWSPQGLSFVTNVSLHYVMPIAFVLDWLLFVPKGRLGWRDPIRWLAYPLIYGGWTLVHGALIDWYPYWFIDVAALGVGPALRNFGLLLIFFLILGFGVLAVDRALGHRDRGDRIAPAA